MIEIPNAGAGPSPSGAPAAPGAASPSAGGVGDAAHQAERQAAPVPAGAPGTASAAMIADIGQCIATASLSEAKTLLGWEVEAGRLSKAQADAMLADRGAPGSTGAPTPAERTEADLRAEGIKFDFTGMHDDTTQESAEHQALDWTARAWLVEAGFEKGPGSFLAQQANRCGIAWQKMNDGERHLHAQHQDVVLRDLWGADYQNNVALAAQLVAELDAKRPGLRDLLASTGAAYDPLVISQIYTRAKELADARGITWPPK